LTVFRVSMRIAGFLKSSLLDWDGRVTAVIFLPGCNFRCPFCHNSELVLTPGDMPEVDQEAMMEYLEENSDFLDGVVITGGEPTIHSDLPDLISRLRSLGLMIKLDSNGTNPGMLEDLINAGMIDSVAMDVKGPLDQRYDDFSGVETPLDSIKRSISIIMESGIDYEFRTTVVPHMINEEELEAMAAFIGGARKYALQQFRPDNTLDERLSKIDPYPTERMRSMADLAKQYVQKVVIRGDL
jgi:pyruvate formate lyase activating enzyme